MNRTRLGEASINNLGIATDESKVFGSLSQRVPITPLFIKLGGSAHKNYHLRGKDEWKKEAEKRRQEQQVGDEKKENSRK